MSDQEDNWGKLYWAFNCPLQMWPDDGGWRVVNYMPRREEVCELDSRVTEEELPQFCQDAASCLRNLAALFELLGQRQIDTIYYPDERPQDAIEEAIKDRPAQEDGSEAGKS